MVGVSSIVIMGVASLCVFFQYIAVAFAIRALRLPTSITAIEGGRAEFNCSTENRTDGEELYWAIKWNTGGSLFMWYYLPAGVTIQHNYFLRGMSFTPISGASLGDHGRYSTVHRETTRSSDGSRVDVYLLRVEDITGGDQGSFHCVLKKGDTFVNLYSPEQSGQGLLAVVVPPDGDVPACGVSQIASADPTVGGARILLSCISSVIATDTPPTITWITGGRELSSTAGNVNLYRYTLNERDNGRAFTCFVSHPSLPSPRTCSVSPLNEPPLAVMAPEYLVAAVGSDAELKCIGSGIPFIVRYTWYVSGRSITHSNTEGPRVSFADSEGWTLRLTSLQYSWNNTEVTCEVSLPSGLSSNVTAVIRLTESPLLTVILSPKRIRVFRDAEIAFTCFAEPDISNLNYAWYVGGLPALVNSTSDSQPFTITTLGRSGSILQISKEHALRFQGDVVVRCEAMTSQTSSKASDSGILISRKITPASVIVTPKIIEIPVGDKATLSCDTQPTGAVLNMTILWDVSCEPPTRDLFDGELGYYTSENGGRITLAASIREGRCDVTCTMSTPFGLAASAMGLVLVRDPDEQPVAVGNVKQPETRATTWRLPNALASGGIGIFLGVFFCTLLYLAYSCVKGYSHYAKAGGASRVQVSTPIYETINPQRGNRGQVAPEVPMVGLVSAANRQCQQQCDATYNRPPLAIPASRGSRVAMPVQRAGLQRVPSSDADADSVTSSISKDSLDTELGINSSPSTATFGRASDSDDHEYESCEITTCV